MKKAVSLFILSALLLSVGPAAGSEQESRNNGKRNEMTNGVLINVKGNQIANGVVMLEIAKDGKPFELQCNHGLSSCTVLHNGEYQLVELPRNSGLYDCKGVHVYPEPAVVQGKDKKLGEYCLIEK